MTPILTSNKIDRSFFDLLYTRATISRGTLVCTINLAVSLMAAHLTSITRPTRIAEFCIRPNESISPDLKF